MDPVHQMILAFSWNTGRLFSGAPVWSDIPNRHLEFRSGLLTSQEVLSCKTEYSVSVSCPMTAEGDNTPGSSSISLCRGATESSERLA
jgi:hypothetical protein